MHDLRIGVDIGGVLSRQANRHDPELEDTMFGDNYLNTPQEPGCMDALKLLLAVGVVDRANLFIISKCGENVERKSRGWLHYQHFDGPIFYRRNIRFCRKRHEKAPIAQELELDFFIDDRLEVLAHMKGIVPNLIWYKPKDKERGKVFPGAPDVVQGIQESQNWFEVLVAIHHASRVNPIVGAL